MPYHLIFSNVHRRSIPPAVVPPFAPLYHSFRLFFYACSSQGCFILLPCFFLPLGQNTNRNKTSAIKMLPCQQTIDSPPFLFSPLSHPIRTIAYLRSINGFISQCSFFLAFFFFAFSIIIFQEQQIAFLSMAFVCERKGSSEDGKKTSSCLPAYPG